MTQRLLNLPERTKGIYMSNKNYFRKLLGWITSETEFSDQNKMLLALLCTIAAIVLGCLYYGVSKWEYWLNPRFFLLEDKLRPRIPELMHGLFGLFLLAPLYLRKLLPFKSISPYHCLALALNIVLFAVVAQLVIGPSNSFSHTWTTTFLIAALALTWLGMRSLAGISCIGIFILAGYNMIHASHSLKYFGLLFLICGFFSMIFQTRLSPSALFMFFKTEFKGISEGEYANSIRQNVHDGVDQASNLARKGFDVAVKAGI